jgi:tubulin beta
LIDLEPSQINSLRNEAVGSLFNPEYFIAGKTGAGNNWARGHYTEGAELMEKVMEVTRKQTEACDSMQGFQVVHSIGGGTGSGMGSLLINRLRDEYQNRIINTFTVVPSPKVSETVVEPYNAVLSLKELIKGTDETIIFDNEALYDICRNTLKLSSPQLSDLNHLISMTMAGITTCFRYPGQLNTDLRKLYTNMCPYPALHFFLPGFAPLTTTSTFNQYSNYSVKHLVKDLFNSRHQMAAYDACSGKYLTCAAIFRGLVSSKDVEEAMVDIQRCNSDSFVNWIPNNIKTAICDIPPRGLCFSATFLANTTAITLSFNRLIEQFDSMFSKRAFVHWYTAEGMEEQEFIEAKESIVHLCEEYLDAGREDEDDQEDFMVDDEICSNCSECQEPSCECNCKKGEIQS